MPVSTRRIAGTAVALAAAAGLVLPGVANAKDAPAGGDGTGSLSSLSSLGDSSLGELATTASLEGVINSLTGGAPQLEAEVDAEDASRLDVTLTTYAPAGDGADDVACAAQVGGPLSGLGDVPTAAELSKDADPLLAVNNSDEDAESASTTLDAADLDGGLYIITSACWHTDGSGDDAAAKAGTLASGNAIVFTVGGDDVSVQAMLPTGVAALLDSIVTDD